MNFKYFIISHCSIVLDILSNIVITLKSQNLESNKVIIIIIIKGKDRCFIENWRPTSLLNVYAKIMSKMIGTKIKNLLPNIIHHKADMSKTDTSVKQYDLYRISWTLQIERIFLVFV